MVTVSVKLMTGDVRTFDLYSLSEPEDLPSTVLDELADRVENFTGISICCMNLVNTKNGEINPPFVYDGDAFVMEIIPCKES